MVVPELTTIYSVNMAVYVSANIPIITGIRNIIIFMLPAMPPSGAACPDRFCSRAVINWLKKLSPTERMGKIKNPFTLLCLPSLRNNPVTLLYVLSLSMFSNVAALNACPFASGVSVFTLSFLRTLSNDL